MKKISLKTKKNNSNQAYLINVLACFMLGNFAFMPLAGWGMGIVGQSWQETLLVMLNLSAWMSVLILYIARIELSSSVRNICREAGFYKAGVSIENLAISVMKEVQRKDKALTVDLVERRITSKQDLSKALEQIVGLAYNLLKAESAELALFDPRLGMYHSSFVMGRPFKKSAQAMLSGALQGKEEEDEDIEVIVQPIAFAGTVLGSLRVAMPVDSKPSLGDMEIMRVLAVQGALAIVNGQYTAQLLRMQQVSEEALRAKTGFLANLSHEIRGPLGIMLNAVELVLDGICGPVNDDQLDTLKMVRTNGEHLLELINDVLDYAKIESGKLNVKFEDVLAGEVLKDISQVIRKQAESKKHTVVFKENTDLLAFSCDRRHLRQMLINLLTNAIKYTPDGGNIEIWADRSPGGRVRLNVKDSGVGIEEKDRNKVFSAFERIEHSYSMTQVGTGLGMSLTKRLAEVNNGQIDFNSTPGAGTHFWLTFPGVNYDASKFIPSIESESQQRGRGEGVLLFETDPNERSMTERYLQSQGYKVFAVENKEDGLELLRTHQIELVLLENKIFDQIDQMQIQEFRDCAGTSFLPIILITSRAFAADIENYLRMGIDLCLIKPVALKDLAKISRELIDGEYSQLGANKSSEKSKPLRSEVLHVATKTSIEEVN